MPISTVKKWKADGGYGFLTNPEGGPDIFVHCSDIIGTGTKNLTAGERVQFEIVPTDKGFRAANVQPLD